ncbi:MAG: hypothetical protein IPP21_00255 [Betaproteobacteria bacterium]|nr:hypothetical protein [Betaproteobacteria bacterium]
MRAPQGTQPRASAAEHAQQREQHGQEHPRRHHHGEQQVDGRGRLHAQAEDQHQVGQRGLEHGDAGRHHKFSDGQGQARFMGQAGRHQVEVEQIGGHDRADPQRHGHHVGRECAAVVRHGGEVLQFGFDRIGQSARAAVELVRTPEATWLNPPET